MITLAALPFSRGGRAPGIPAGGVISRGEDWDDGSSAGGAEPDEGREGGGGVPSCPMPKTLSRLSSGKAACTSTAAPTYLQHARTRQRLEWCALSAG